MYIHIDMYIYVHIYPRNLNHVPSHHCWFNTVVTDLLRPWGTFLWHSTSGRCHHSCWSQWWYLKAWDENMLKTVDRWKLHLSWPIWPISWQTPDIPSIIFFTTAGVNSWVSWVSGWNPCDPSPSGAPSGENAAERTWKKSRKRWMNVHPTSMNSSPNKCHG